MQGSIRNVQRLAGLSGIAVGVLAASTGPLYFMVSEPPPDWSVLSRALINIVAAGLMVVFLIGLIERMRARGARAWTDLVSSAGLLFIGVTLVAISLEAGGVLEISDGSVDPTVDGPLAHGAMLLHGSIARMLAAMLLAGAGYVISRVGGLPRWTGRLSYLFAIFNLAFVPALFFGTDAAQFYSAIGWGNSALAQGLVAWWMLILGIVILRRPDLVAPNPQFEENPTATTV